MISLLDLNYYVHENISTPGEVLNIQKASAGYVHFIKDHLSIQLVKHAAFTGEITQEGVRYNFFTGRNKFWYIPIKAHRYIKKQKPDIVLVQGLIFPLQLLALRFTLGSNTKIIVQHHGEKPFSGIKKIIQRIAGRYITAYLFTSKGNAAEWIKEKIIPNDSCCYEVLEASTSFSKQDQQQSEIMLRADGIIPFLWVGRLHVLKDPLTVLEAFEKFIAEKPEVRLYMIYQTEELLPSIKKILENNNTLKNKVHLIGTVPHGQLQAWYNAADFFISGSHKEGSGYSLLEAMACGCIPVVTAIPSFIKITDNGSKGFLYKPGNAGSLLQVLLKLDKIHKKEYAGTIIDYFQTSLSFKKIAEDLAGLCNALQVK